MTKQLLLVLALLAFALSGFSQSALKKESPKDPVSKEERYKKLKELYIKELDSKSHRTADSLFQVFIYKITLDVEIDELPEDPQTYVAWAKDNLSKTEFKDAAEVEKLWGEYRKNTDITIKENSAYYDYMMETFKYEGGISLNTEVMMDVMSDHPEKFNRIKLPERKKKSDFYPKMPGQ
jgi:hypothetical protein